MFCISNGSPPLGHDKSTTYFVTGTVFSFEDSFESLQKWRLVYDAPRENQQHCALCHTLSEFEDTACSALFKYLFSTQQALKSGKMVSSQWRTGLNGPR